VLKLSRSQLLAQTAAAAVLGPHIAGAQTLEKLRFTGVVTDDMTPIFYAIQKGLYRRAGLDVEIVGPRAAPRPRKPSSPGHTKSEKGA
jgi:ABC-type nitrate/sulfonate/bicarbonate transport system substrate-binding protein